MNLVYEIISILIIFFSKAFFIFIVLLIHDSKTSVPLKDLQHPEKIEPATPEPKTREELKEKIFAQGCDMMCGDMFLYAPCYNPRVNPGNGFAPCSEDCICFNSFFESECKRLNL